MLSKLLSVAISSQLWNGQKRENVQIWTAGGYMRRLFDPGLFSLDTFLSKEIPLFQHLLITMGFNKIHNHVFSKSREHLFQGLRNQLTISLKKFDWQQYFLLVGFVPCTCVYLCFDKLDFSGTSVPRLWLLEELYLATGKTWKLHKC